MPCTFMSFFISFTPAFSIFHVIWQWSWVCTIFMSSWTINLYFCLFSINYLLPFFKIYDTFFHVVQFLLLLYYTFFLKSHILSAAARLLFSIEFTVFFKLIPMGMFNISIYIFPVFLFFLMTTTLPLHPPFTRDYNIQ